MEKRSPTKLSGDQPLSPLCLLLGTRLHNNDREWFWLKDEFPFSTLRYTQFQQHRFMGVKGFIITAEVVGIRKQSHERCNYKPAILLTSINKRSVNYTHSDLTKTASLNSLLELLAVEREEFHPVSLNALLQSRPGTLRPYRLFNLGHISKSPLGCMA